MMINRMIQIAFLVCVATSLAGCWDQAELQRRALVSAIGIDKGERAGEITLTLQAIIMNKLSTPMLGGRVSQSAVRTVSTHGKTVLEALSSFKYQTNNSPYLQHNNLLVISEDLAREGIGPVIDYFMRSPAIKTRGWILVCRGKASAVLQWPSEVRQVPADFIVQLVASRNALAPMMVEDIHQFIIKLSNPSSSPATSGIEIDRPDSHLPPEVRIFGTAVFKRDKMVGWLNLHETRGLLWVINQFGRGILETSWEGKPHQIASLINTRSSVKIDPVLDHGRIHLQVKINTRGDLYEQSGGIPLTDKKVVQSLEVKAAEGINREVRAALHKCQKELNSDIFGFGDAIERKFPQRWKTLQSKWSTVFPRLEIKVASKVTVTGSGTLTDPVIIKQ